MSLLSALDRAFPRLAFARRVPPDQIATRLTRQLRRRLLGKPAMARLAPLHLRESLPAPVLAAHRHAVTRAGGVWRFGFLGRTVEMAGVIDWQAPSAHRNDQLWRMNLHYMEYLGGLPRDAAETAIGEWIAANPLTRPGALGDAWNAYALSIRVVMWLQWLAREGAAASQPLRAAMEASLHQQLSYLLANPETDIGGNHLVRNVRALLWASACTEGAASEALRRRGEALLTAILAQQILTDGMHFELSPSYHCQVLNDFTECHAVMTEGPLRARLGKTIAAMRAAAAILVHPDGQVAQFGDSGLTMAQVPEGITAAPGVLAEGGMAQWHGAGMALIARFGAFAAESLPAHGHADSGSIEVSVQGQRMIVDQGVFAYVAGDARRASRCAASHNIATAGDGEMAHFFGDFRLGRRPRVTGSARLEDGRLSLVCRHDGYSAGGRPLVLSRHLTADRRGIAIADSTDRITPGGVTRLLLHPDCAAAPDGDALILSRGEARLRLTADAPVALEEAVWWPDMGREMPTRRIVIAWPTGATGCRLVMAAG